MSALEEAIVDCLAAHAEALERVGTDRPEEHAQLGADLILAMRRQRAKVERSLGGAPRDHAARVRALAKGVRYCVARLAELDP